MSKILTILSFNLTAATVAYNSRRGVVSVSSSTGDNLDLLNTETDLLLVILLKYVEICRKLNCNLNIYEAFYLIFVCISTKPTTN